MMIRDFNIAPGLYFQGAHAGSEALNCRTVNDLEPPRIDALPRGQHHSPGLVVSYVRRDLETAVFLSTYSLNAFAGPHRKSIGFDNLVPAREQLFLAGPIEPELSFGRAAIRFGIYPF